MTLLSVAPFGGAAVRRDDLEGIHENNQRRVYLQHALVTRVFSY